MNYQEMYDSIAKDPGRYSGYFGIEDGKVYLQYLRSLKERIKPFKAMISTDKTKVRIHYKGLRHDAALDPKTSVNQPLNRRWRVPRPVIKDYLADLAEDEASDLWILGKWAIEVDRLEADLKDQINDVDWKIKSAKSNQVRRKHRRSRNPFAAKPFLQRLPPPEDEDTA